MSAARNAASVVLLGTLITLVGLSWDVQWHVEVGPDTFFTLPHLFLYAGSAVSGIAALIMVLLSTAAQRAGRSLACGVGGPAVKVLGGTFNAPLGYLVAGTGAALFLLYGLLDLWWHSIYGFDAVLNTPSHVALFLSISVTMVGSIVIFAASRDQRWGRLGLLLAIAVLIVFGPVTFNGFTGLELPVDPSTVGVLLCAPLLLVMGAVLLGRWNAVRIAVVLGIVQAFLWWFSPWATEAYAASVGLPLREGLRDGAPRIPNSIPMFLIVAALAVEGLLILGRSGRLRSRTLIPLTGGCAGVLVVCGLVAQTAVVSGFSRFNPAGTAPLLLLGLVTGVAAGYLGSRFAVLLRVCGEVSR